MSHPSASDCPGIPGAGHQVSPTGHAPGSFRDPSGRLLRWRGRILRVVNERGERDLSEFLASGTAARLRAQSKLIGTRTLDAEERRQLEGDAGLRELLAGGATVLEHEPVPFPSYPSEWPPEMLYAAGQLTLDIFEQLLQEGLGLKDATPFNVLFRGNQPVFVDLLSFERREPGDATWQAYAQFTRTFLLPLLANRHFDLTLQQVFLAGREGLEPQAVYRMSHTLQRLSPLFLSHVSLPSWLGSRASGDAPEVYQRKTDRDPAQAKFILERLMGSLRRGLRAVAPAAKRSSSWSGYLECDHRSDAYVGAKHRFVAAALHEHDPASVLDVGCNTGEFSALAARSGARVVAIDSDPVVVGQTWRLARDSQLDMLPLVVNLARPTPSSGWRNGETLSFLERAIGHFDAVFMLAVLHHLLVTEGVPLSEVLRLAADLTTRMAVIEFIEPADPMFQRIVRGRDHLYQHLDVQEFERSCEPFFKVVRRERIANTSRWMFLLRKRG